MSLRSRGEIKESNKDIQLFEVMGLTSFVLTTSRVQTFWGAVGTLQLVPTLGFSQGSDGDFTGSQWSERSWGPCIP